jgi:hypothetical protein
MSDNAIPLFALVLLRMHIELQLQQNFFLSFSSFFEKRKVNDGIASGKNRYGDVC